MTAKPRRGVPAPLNARRAARLAAVQALYQVDLVGAAPETAIDEFLLHRLGGTAPDPLCVGADRALFCDLVRGVAARREDLDRMVGAVLAEGWTLERLEVILRAILRAGAYELLARSDVPAKVVIDEYVGIAHAFFAGNEPGFVNGALDRLGRQLRSDEFRTTEGG